MALACAAVQHGKNKRMRYRRHSERNDSGAKNPELMWDIKRDPSEYLWMIFHIFVETRFIASFVYVKTNYLTE